MSQYKVTSLNYVLSGKKERIVNLDMELPYLTEDDIGLSGRTDGGVPLICLEGCNTITRLVTGSRNKIGKTKFKNVTFVANVQEDDDTMGPFCNSNQFSMYDMTNGQVIHALYDMRDMCLKSNIRKITEGHQEKNNTDKFIDIYSPSIETSPIHVVKIEDYAYAISERTSDGPLYLRTNLDELRKTDKPGKINDSKFNFKLKGGQLNTYLYGKDRYAELSSNFLNRVNLSGLEYNYIYEIPLDSSEYNDFPNGDMQAEILQAKNIYNSLYSMQISSENSLQGTRRYCGSGNCVDKLYLKYFDNVSYEPTLSVYDEDSRISNVTSIGTNGKYSYQKLEVVESINRFKSNIKHKSNLYSISIRNTGLNTDYSDSHINEKVQHLKMDIRNNIRDIVRQICPVNTQLFDIYFDGV